MSPADNPAESREISPLAGALSISASMFVAGTSIFVAIMAFVAGSHQLDTTGLTGGVRNPDEAARWWSYGLGVAVLVDGYVAGKYARKRPRVALVTSAAFVALTVGIGALYLSVW